jgi:hypothetical protein
MEFVVRINIAVVVAGDCDNRGRIMHVRLVRLPVIVDDLTAIIDDSS